MSAGLDLISKLLDDSITDEEFANLSRMMEFSPRLRQTYIQAVDQEVELSCHESCEGVKAPVGSRRKALLALAAILLVSFVSLLFIRPTGKDEPKVVETDPSPVMMMRRIPPGPDTWEGILKLGYHRDGMLNLSEPACRTVPVVPSERDQRQRGIKHSATSHRQWRGPPDT